MKSRVEQIEELINQALAPIKIEIVDGSQAHAGHAGAREGGGHFSATIISDAFAGKSSVQRHQMVYKALGDMMRSEIHALSIKAFTPQEINT